MPTYTPNKDNILFLCICFIVFILFLISFLNTLLSPLLVSDPAEALRGSGHDQAKAQISQRAGFHAHSAGGQRRRCQRTKLDT